MFECGAGAAEILEVAASTQRGLVEHECRVLELAASWADCHPAEAVGAEAQAEPEPVVDVARRPGGVGTPCVLGFCLAEFGAVLQTTTGAADALVADALDLRHRLPQLWRLVTGAGVRAWKARKVAQATRHLSLDAAAAVDAAVAESISSVPWARFERLLEAAIMLADPVDAEARARAWEAERFVRAGRSVAGLKTLVARAQAGEVIWFMAMVNRLAEILAADGDTDPVEVRRSKALGILANPARALEMLAAHADDHADDDADADPGENDDSNDDHRSVAVEPPVVSPRRLQPTVVVYVHLSEEAVRGGPGVARMEGEGPITVDQLRRFLGGADCRIRVQPVLDLGALPAVDRYEVSGTLRSAVLIRHPADVFPWGVCTSRSMDMDHSIPYLQPDKGGPPGQTGLGKVGPLVRFHHLVRTFGGWSVSQPEPGQFLWRSPHGWHYLVNHAGTHDLGNGPLSQAFWRAARGLISSWTPAA